MYTTIRYRYYQGASRLPRGIATASPYHKDHSIEQAARDLAAKHVDLIVMDCMGYTQDMKLKVHKESGEPVVLSRTIVARVAGELLE